MDIGEASLRDRFLNILYEKKQQLAKRLFLLSAATTTASLGSMTKNQKSFKKSKEQGSGNTCSSSQQQSQRKLASATAQHQQRQQHTGIVDDIPHFSDDRSLDLDSLDITPRQLKVNLNSDTASLGSSRSTACGSVGSGGSGWSTGGKRSGTTMASLVEDDHVDVPNLDDDLSLSLPKSAAGGADAAAGVREKSRKTVTIIEDDSATPLPSRRRRASARMVRTPSGRAAFVRGSMAASAVPGFYGGSFDPDEFDDNGDLIQQRVSRWRGPCLCFALLLVVLAAAAGFLAGAVPVWRRGEAGRSVEQSEVAVLMDIAAFTGSEEAVPESAEINATASTSVSVAEMSNKERLQLAELIHHSCENYHSLLGNSSAKIECQNMCHEKACCFTQEREEEEGQRGLRGRGSRLLEAATLKLDVIETPGDSTFTYAREGVQVPDGDEMPDRSAFVTTTMAEHDSIKGKEESSDVIARITASPSPLNENCITDPEQFCTTYAGCVSFFGE